MKSKLEFSLSADTKEEMIEKLEKSLKFIKDDFEILNDGKKKEETCDSDCENCENFNSLEDVLNDLQHCIATLIYYDMGIPLDLVKSYNTALEHYVNEPWPDANSEDN